MSNDYQSRAKRHFQLTLRHWFILHLSFCLTYWWLLGIVDEPMQRAIKIASNCVIRGCQVMIGEQAFGPFGSLSVVLVGQGIWHALSILVAAAVIGHITALLLDSIVRVWSGESHA
jgi:hypothetical protein